MTAHPMVTHSFTLKRSSVLSIDHFNTINTTQLEICLINTQFLYFQYDNVNSCLKVLAASNVGGLEAVTTNDICTGRLQAVLALFFALSRYKQASKQKSVVCTPAKQQIYQNHIQQNPVVVNATSENNMTNR